MKIKTKDFEAQLKHKKILKHHKTKIGNLFSDEDKAKKNLKKFTETIAKHQEQLFAQNEWSVLIILQGMDTSGKDGLIEHVLSGLNPQGCEVTSFKKPTHLELDHDFLWRTHQNMPQRGRIGVFNRSYYEDVIVPYVHPSAMDVSQLPQNLRRDKDLLKNRCKDITRFEEYLSRQGVLIIKFFLHLSKDEQKNRLLARLETPEKNWKFEESDIEERGFWSDYQEAYDFCITHTSHESAPWYILPADDKVTARLIASEIIAEKLDGLNLKYPKVDEARKKILKKIEGKLKNSK